MNNENQEMIKPFKMDIDYAALRKEVEEEKLSPTPIKPFTIDEDYAKSKSTLYLILLYFDKDGEGAEADQVFEFVTGRQNVYDTLKNYLLDKNTKLDAMRSRILVDNPKVTISRKLSIFSFMLSVRENGKVEDDSSFDIYDYYYNEENGENGKTE